VASLVPRPPPDFIMQCGLCRHGGRIFLHDCKIKSGGWPGDEGSWWLEPSLAWICLAGLSAAVHFELCTSKPCVPGSLVLC